MKSDLIDLTVEIHHQTDKAWLLSDDGNRENAVWIPKSQAEIEYNGRTHILTCHEWLALDKGLI